MTEKKTKPQTGWMIRLIDTEEERIARYEDDLLERLSEHLPGVPMPSRAHVLKSLLLAGLAAWEVK